MNLSIKIVILLLLFLFFYLMYIDKNKNKKKKEKLKKIIENKIENINEELGCVKNIYEYQYIYEDGYNRVKDSVDKLKKILNNILDENNINEINKIKNEIKRGGEEIRINIPNKDKLATSILEDNIEHILKTSTKIIILINDYKMVI